MINPKDYESKKEIKYCVENWIGGPVFKSYNQEGLELEFVLDTTGVLTKLGDDKFGKSLKSLINDLSETVYQYIGTVHQPGFVKVIWGELNFQGRLQQMDIKYTMFDEWCSAACNRATQVDKVYGCENLPVADVEQFSGSLACGYCKRRRYTS